MDRLQLERAALDRRAQKLPDDWRVYIEPDVSAVPAPLRSYKFDALATNGKEGIVFEVVQGRDSLKGDEIDKIRGIREAVNNTPGWSLEVLVLPKPAPTLLPKDAVVRRLNEALHIAAASPDAAFLLGFSPLEWALAVLAERHSIDYSPSVQQTASRLVNAGVLDQDTFEQIARFQRIRNSIAHAARTDSGTTEVELKELVRIITRLIALSESE